MQPRLRRVTFSEFDPSTARTALQMFHERKAGAARCYAHMREELRAHDILIAQILHRQLVIRSKRLIAISVRVASHHLSSKIGPHRIEPKLPDELRHGWIEEEMRSIPRADQHWQLVDVGGRISMPRAEEALDIRVHLKALIKYRSAIGVDRSSPRKQRRHEGNDTYSES